MKRSHSFVFDCPIHGMEFCVNCFRAFSKENRHLWKKYAVTMVEMEFKPQELEEFLKGRLAAPVVLERTYGA